jgi:hypothetical protein
VFHNVRILAAAEWSVAEPAPTTPQSEKNAAEKHTLLNPNAKFERWFADKGPKPTTRDVGDFARDNAYTRDSVEKLVVSRIGPRRKGRRAKGNAPK